jgi:adenylate cyclase
VFYADVVAETLQSGESASFLVDDEADVLVATSPDAEAVFQTYRAFTLAMRAETSGRQKLFLGADGKSYYGAFTRFTEPSACMVTVVSCDAIFAGVRRETARALVVSFAVLVLATAFMALFGRSLSERLNSLTRAVHLIENNVYDAPLPTTGSDEIASLAESFINMRHGLENFERFTNRQMVALAKTGKIKRYGEDRNVTVCFTLVRNFEEEFSSLQAADMVSYLNDYLRAMLPAISATGGVVDKFLTQDGVVIMSVWGTTPSADEQRVSARMQSVRNALAAVRSCVAMRRLLRDFNRRHHLRVKMASGINSGPVVAGQIGGEQRMEYTVIGDTVNLAARLEAPNNTFDTDILITENTYRLISDYIMVEEMPRIVVQGKDGAMRVFAVVNIRGFYGPQDIASARALWRFP